MGGTDEEGKPHRLDEEQQIRERLQARKEGRNSEEAIRERLTSRHRSPRDRDRSATHCTSPPIRNSPDDSSYGRPGSERAGRDRSLEGYRGGGGGGGGDQRRRHPRDRRRGFPSNDRYPPHRLPHSRSSREHPNQPPRDQHYRRDFYYQQGHRSRSPEVDAYGRQLREPSRSRSRSRRSYSRSASPSRSADPYARRHRSPSTSSASSSYSSRSSRSSRSGSTRSSRSTSTSSRSSAASRSSRSDTNSHKIQPDIYTKDQRTVFVNQLVMRATERDVKHYFKAAGLKVNDVIMLRDRRTGRHKGCAYVELTLMEHVPKALALSGKPPEFQRFPILVKPSEAEKNYVAAAVSAAAASSPIPKPILTSKGIYINPVNLPKAMGPDGKYHESQRVYVGSLDPSITAEHLFALFQSFGDLQKVAVQMDDAGISKGYAFLTFTCPKASFLAIQTLGGQVLAGRTIKTGWANHVPTGNVEIVQSDEFPPDATKRIQAALQALAQLNMGVMPALMPIVATTVTAPPAVMTTVTPVMVPTNVVGSTNRASAISTTTNAIPPSRVGTVAEARASLAAGAVIPVVPSVSSAPPPVDVTLITNADKPTRFLMVHNMYDKDTEVDPNWDVELKEEFLEECTKFGKIIQLKVLSKEPGGKILCQFDTVAEAQKCASNLAGRWFDKRMLRVEFMLPEVAQPLLLGAL